MNVRALAPALRRLVQQGILRSRRGGVESGFLFTKSPDEISLWDIVSSLEGDMTMSCCKEVINVACDCDSHLGCKVNRIINDGLSRIKDDLKNLSVRQFTNEE